MELIVLIYSGVSDDVCFSMEK